MATKMSDGEKMRARTPGMLLSVLLVASLAVACAGGSDSADSAASGSASGDSLCQDLNGVLDAVATIREMASNADPTAALAGLADLRDSLLVDAQSLKDKGLAEVAAKVEALAVQIDMVVQRNTLEGTGTGDPGTDPTVNVEEKARAAADAAGCAPEA